MVSLSYGHGKLLDFSNSDDSLTSYGSTTYTATSNGAADGTTIVNTAHTQGNDYWNGYTVLMLTGTCAGESAVISDFDAASDTLTLTGTGFTAQIDSGDTYQITKWGKVEDGQTISAAIEYTDYLVITASGSAGNAAGYYEYKLDTSTVLTATYAKSRERYKTSDGSVKAKIVLVFTDGTTQTVLDNSSSTTLTVPTAVTTTTAKTVDKIRFYCNTAAGSTYYDFLLIYKGDFTFPTWDIMLPVFPDRYVDPAGIGMGGAFTQGMGTDLARWDMTVDLSDFNTWTRTSLSDVRDGEVFFDVWHNAHHQTSPEPWQWFNSGLEQCKVTLRNLKFVRRCPNGKLDYVANFSLVEKRCSSAYNQHEDYVSRLGCHLT